MTEFRNAIAGALAQPYCANAVSFYEASSVLAMPEMQAIRNVLYCVAQHGETCTCGYDALLDQPSVSAWVLDEGSNP